MHNSNSQNTNHAFWLDVGWQKQLAAALYTNACLPFIQACNCPALMRSSAALNTKYAFQLNVGCYQLLLAVLCHTVKTRHFAWSYCTASKNKLVCFQKKACDYLEHPKKGLISQDLMRQFTTG